VGDPIFVGLTNDAYFYLMLVAAFVIVLIIFLVKNITTLNKYGWSGLYLLVFLQGFAIFALSVFAVLVFIAIWQASRFLFWNIFLFSFGLSNFLSWTLVLLLIVLITKFLGEWPALAIVGIFMFGFLLLKNILATIVFVFVLPYVLYHYLFPLVFSPELTKLLSIIITVCLALWWFIRYKESAGSGMTDG